jgi:lysophospholipase L1-like esterase
MNRNRQRSVLRAALGVAVALGCACGCRPVESAMPVDSPPTAAQWQAFAARRIVFGHQSVGRNILGGVATLAAGAGVALPITETRDGATAPGIAHFGVGANGDPLGKIRDFAAVMDGPAGAGADIALLKLCYIDFSGTADPAMLAAAYGDTLAHLQQRHPATAFVAVTAPLTTVQTGPKALVKKLLGRAPDGRVENTRREAFNAVLRARFGAEGRLFDLAALESGGGDALNAALTSDGGHLNDAGARLVAERFVAFLAGLPPAPSGTKAP